MGKKDYVQQIKASASLDLDLKKRFYQPTSCIFQSRSEWFWAVPTSSVRKTFLASRTVGTLK
jgi:hypothetical protein